MRCTNVWTKCDVWTFKAKAVYTHTHIYIYNHRGARNIISGSLLCVVYTTSPPWYMACSYRFTSLVYRFLYTRVTSRTTIPFLAARGCRREVGLVGDGGGCKTTNTTIEVRHALELHTNGTDILEKAKSATQCTTPLPKCVPKYILQLKHELSTRFG